MQQLHCEESGRDRNKPWQMKTIVKQKGVTVCNDDLGQVSLYG